MKKNDFSHARREFIKKTGVASAALLSLSALSSVIPMGNGKAGKGDWLGPRAAEAAPTAPSTGAIKDKLRATFGDRKIEMSHVTMKTPIIAENGAVVPVSISSDLPMEPGNYVKKIYIFVDANYNPFIASMDLTPASGKAAFSLRIKMRKTSQVRAIVETNKGKLYGMTKTVKVTIGGCGG
ncbi:MAG: thiosulfate oxidation carrier protein SoxY [Deltaproteobacteria bacterium]|nr:thiosulfate oxidation carrier protein SoxY [Deltaproteobacteria bacterium]